MTLEELIILARQAAASDSVPLPIAANAGDLAPLAALLNDLLRNNREAGRHHQAIFEAVGGGIMVLDEAMRIRAVNASFKKMFPTAGDNPLGSYCHEIICRDQKLAECCPFQIVLREGTTTHLTDWKINSRHYDVVATPILDPRDKTSRGAVLLYLDITEHKLAAVTLAAEKESLAVTLRSIADAVITTDIEGRIVLMNRVAERLTGWSQQEARDKPARDIFWIVDEQNRRSCLDLPQEIMENGREIQRAGDTILISQDGTERLITVSAAPITAADGKGLGSVLTFRDITAEKKQEEELRKAREIQSLGLVAGGIAHDFNNLLTAIIGNINLARMFSEPDGKAAERLSQAEKSIFRARDLTQQLLTFAQGGAPRRRLVPVAELIRETTHAALAGTHVNCHFRIAADLWPANIDENQIKQVVNHLVSNAVQAMPEGGALTVEAKKTFIDQTDTLPAGPYVKVSFADTGKGISPEIQEKIFDPYFSTRPTGRGLGLAVSSSIIRKHKGRLRVDTQPGHGAVFTFHLPAILAAQPAFAESAPGDRTPMAIPGQARILIMDDEEMVRNITGHILKERGFDVETAVDGWEAVRLYRAAMEAGQPFHLVIMDLTVPNGMGGLETLDHLRAIDPAVRAIAASGYSNDEVLTTHRQYGFLGMLAKPYHAVELLQAIQQILAGDKN
ncbi:MAG: hypothetical protein A2521_00970 [Deltaproteobacteria bacterium RIFOXYD12_FULL_57_12]|nr:MAG: hypothetical protein A2521_00970 [Deltaproteobacteria bacterium RIFOXYD12_FULL_57_12]